MRAFVTIIVDAFRETIVSKTMWVLLAMATVFLAALAPLSIVERGPTRFDWQDFRDQDGLIREIRRQAAEARPSPGKQIAKLDAELAPHANGEPHDVPPEPGPEPRPTETQPPGQSPPRFPHSSSVMASLNEIVKSRELYDRDVWTGVKLDDEANELVDRDVDTLDDKQVARLNRLLIEAAYGRFLNVAATKSYVGWATWEWDEPLPVEKSQILAPALTFFTDNILGVFGVFIAILVTSTFVPRTFETGAIDLLLSKPVSRSLVFLAKFVGGCLFVLVLSTYVIGGLYLIAGLRLGYWNHRFLWCIPLLFFLFAIYYSVSAMAGVLWRNAIVSVVVSMVFWAVCFGLGFTKSVVFEPWVMTPHRVSRLVAADDTWFAAFRGPGGMPHGAFQRWDSDAGAWVEAFARDENDGTPPPWENRFDAPPTYDPAAKRLLAVGNLFEQKSGAHTGPWLLAASAESDWRQEILGRMPKDVRQLVVRGDGKVLGLSSSGILEVPASAKPLSAEQAKNRDSAPTLECPEFDAEAWALPSAVAARPKSTDLVVYDPGRLRLLRLVDGKRYEAAASYEISPAMNCDADALACAGDRVVLALNDRRILVFAVKDAAFELLAERDSWGASAVRQVRLTADGKSFAARRDDQRVFFYETDGDDSGKPLGGGAQGNVTAIAGSSDGTLAAAYAFNHLLLLDESHQVQSRITPQYSTFEAIYWYFIKPLYTVFPKPGELGNVTAYFLYGKETIAVPGNPDAAEEKLDIYTPLWSNLAFLSVMLAFGCWYVSRRDF